MASILVRPFQFKISLYTLICYSKLQVLFVGYISHHLEHLQNVITIASFFKTLVF